MRCVVCRWRCQTAVLHLTGHGELQAEIQTAALSSLFAVSILFLPFLSEIIGMLKRKTGQGSTDFYLSVHHQNDSVCY